MKFELTFHNEVDPSDVVNIKLYTINSPMPDRPFPFNGTDAQQVDWEKETRAMQKAAVKEALESVGIVFKGLSFNRKLGCRCGCSPGYSRKSTGFLAPDGLTYRTMYIEFSK